MADVYAPGGPVPHIPDDLTVAQFILDVEHTARPDDQGRPCLIENDTGRPVGFQELRARTDGLARALRSRWNIGEDDVVCIFGPNHVDYPVAVWAVHRLGATVTAANPSYTAEELEYQLDATNSRLLIAHPWNLPAAISAARSAGLSTDRIILFDMECEGSSSTELAGHTTIQELVTEGHSSMQIFIERLFRPGEARHKLAFLSFSSGTTGRPKAVCITHYAVIASIVQLAQLANSQTQRLEDRKIRPGDLWVAFTPFYHIYGLTALMHFALWYRETLVVIPKFDFVGMLKSISRYRINVLPVVPPVVVLLCKHPAVQNYDLSSVRLVTSGAAPLSAELIHQLSAILPSTSIGQGYGMTEAVGSVCFPQVEQKIGTPGSAGRLVPGMIARVLKPDGTVAKAGEVGELLLKGPCVAERYLNNEEATRETFKDGWLYTGDVVTINEHAEVFILDRIKEMLKVRGFQVAPAELEGHLLDHPDVSDVCVVGLPDDYNGELPLAFVVLSADAQHRVSRAPVEANKVRAALEKHVSDTKVRYKWLAGLEFVDSIPKNPSGKLLRRVLRDRAKELQASGKLSMKIRGKL
ncbi:uncharacterized protein FIBRA_07688 [Fibroporia radiculosa]|uniref:Phenylacetyl-CoA ligase n=1 Tax=Fibroporia radiculosa TaxID=599839 RepID=J4I151_9APHY|nr:uncharacterized protein FIBRA_07688 [Fibroporia radiculosa]CCM05467.1 predicted protein [Fibroporia radiculosa]